jgi:hypothetical protein
VAIEAVWLLAAAANRRPITIATLALAAVELAHLPLLLHQRSQGFADFIDDTSLGYRLVRTPKQFLVGFDAPGEVVSAVIAGALVVIALWFVWSRGNERERRTARTGLIVGGTLLTGTALLAVGGVDYFDTRNVLVAWPPLALAVAAGLGAEHSGKASLAATLALLAASGSTIVFVVTQETLQRDDWRDVASALYDDRATPRAVVATPAAAPKPFAVYARSLEPFPEEGADVVEIDIVGLPRRHRTQSRPDDPPRPEDHPAPAGFELVEKRFEDTFTLFRYRAPHPTFVPPPSLFAARLDPDQGAAVFVEP